MTHDLSQRLQSLRLDVTSDTMERHLGAIATALATEVPAASPPRRSRRWSLVIVTAALLSLPVAAVAAERSLPGEAMYPVKRTFEWVRSFVDHDVQATHRVEELEELIDRRAPTDVLRDRLQVAERTVSAGDVDLQRRLDAARRAVDDRPPPPATSDRPPAVEREDDRSGEGPDVSVTTTTTTAEETTTTEATTTTTVTSDGGDGSGGDRDRPPPTSRG